MCRNMNETCVHTLSYDMKQTLVWGYVDWLNDPKAFTHQSITFQTFNTTLKTSFPNKAIQNAWDLTATLMHLKATVTPSTVAAVLSFSWPSVWPQDKTHLPITFPSHHPAPPPLLHLFSFLIVFHSFWQAEPPRQVGRCFSFKVQPHPPLILCVFET